NELLDLAAGCVGAERGSDELLCGALWELAEVHCDDPALGPKPRKQRFDLGPSQREHHQGTIGSLPKSGVDEAHRRHVAPLQIFEDQEKWSRGALGIDEVFPSSKHLIAHELRVSTRCSELYAASIRPRGVDELAEELGHAVDVRRGHMPADSRAQLAM